MHRFGLKLIGLNNAKVLNRSIRINSNLKSTTIFNNKHNNNDIFRSISKKQTNSFSTNTKTPENNNNTQSTTTNKSNENWWSGISPSTEELFSKISSSNKNADPETIKKQQIGNDLKKLHKFLKEYETLKSEKPKETIDTLEWIENNAKKTTTTTIDKSKMSKAEIESMRNFQWAMGHIKLSELNYEEAEKWLRLSSENDFGPAQYELAYLLLERPENPDQKEAWKWMSKSADNGDIQAMYSLGEMYERGFGTNIDINSAIQWYERAAHAEHPMAPYQLGMLYLDDKMVKRDLDKSLKWMKRAQELGNEVASTAIRQIQEFQQRLKGEQINSIENIKIENPIDFIKQRSIHKEKPEKLSLREYALYQYLEVFVTPANSETSKRIRELLMNSSRHGCKAALLAMAHVAISSNELNIAKQALPICKLAPAEMLLGVLEYSLQRAQEQGQQQNENQQQQLSQETKPSKNSIEYLRKAADLGLPSAQFMLASWYLKGLITEENSTTSTATENTNKNNKSIGRDWMWKAANFPIEEDFDEIGLLKFWFGEEDFALIPNELKKFLTTMPTGKDVITDEKDSIARACMSLYALMMEPLTSSNSKPNSSNENKNNNNKEQLSFARGYAEKAMRLGNWYGAAMLARDFKDLNALESLEKAATLGDMDAKQAYLLTKST